MVTLIAYVHHIRGHVITLKTFRQVKAGGKTRREYAHVALPVKEGDGHLIDFAVSRLDKWINASIENGEITYLKDTTDEEVKEYRD